MTPNNNDKKKQQGRSLSTKLKKSSSNVYQEVFGQTQEFGGYVYPKGEHHGGAIDAKWHLRTTSELAWWMETTVIDTIVGYVPLKKQFHDAVLATRKKEWKLDSSNAMHQRYPRLFSAIAKIKILAAKIEGDLEKIVGKELKIRLSDWVLTKWEQIFGEMIEILTNAKEWMNERAIVAHWYMVAGSAETGNIVIPNKVVIEVETDDRIVFINRTARPFFVTNTGLRIIALFLWIMSHVLATEKSTLHGFFGHREWFSAYYQFQEVVDARKPRENSGEHLLATLNELMRILQAAEQTALVQPSTLSDSKNIANVETFRILTATVFEAINCKEIREGELKGVNDFDPKYHHQPITFTAAGSMNAKAKWAKMVQDWRQMIGYPENGPGSNRAFVELKATEGGDGWIECFKCCSCTRDEMKNASTLHVDYTDAISGEAEYWQIEDSQASFIPTVTATVLRDGKIQVPDFHQARLLEVGSIDRWLVTYLRSNIFDAPTIIQSRRHMGENTEWAKVLTGLGIVSPTLAFGLHPTFGGISLPWWDGGNAKTNDLDQLPLVPDFKDWTKMTMQTARDWLKAAIAMEKQLVNAPRKGGANGGKSTNK